MINEDKNIPFFLALTPILMMVSAMLITIVVFEGAPHIPLVFGTIIASLVAWQQGFSWKKIEDSIYDGYTLSITRCSYNNTSWVDYWRLDGRRDSSY
ncbi:MAG: hypothetical protein L0H51_09420, partial [Psychrobacter sp.]|nr:hypothetical protein [Psychrobacter sp.]